MCNIGTHELRVREFVLDDWAGVGEETLFNCFGERCNRQLLRTKQMNAYLTFRHIFDIRPQKRVWGHLYQSVKETARQKSTVHNESQ